MSENSDGAQPAPAGFNKRTGRLNFSIRQSGCPFFYVITKGQVTPAQRSRTEREQKRTVSDVPFFASHFDECWISRIGSDGFPIIRRLIACAALYSGYHTDWESQKQAIRQKVLFCDPGSRNAGHLRTITFYASLDPESTAKVCQAGDDGVARWEFNPHQSRGGSETFCTCAKFRAVFKE